MISCVDSSDFQISYYVAPVVDDSSTAIISFRNVRELSHFVKNDAANNLLREEGFSRDMICSDGDTHYLFFHNEYFRVVGDVAEQRLSDDSNSANLASIIGPEMNR